MATTLLARKSGGPDTVIATDDDHYEIMANDPSIPEVQPNNSYNTPTWSSNFGSTAPVITSPGTTNMNVSKGNQPVLTGAGQNAAEDATVLVNNDNTDWINKKWRPVMGWVYMLTCTCDFILFPILWSILQALTRGNVSSQWQPVTLQGAGLYHIAMGAVLGIAAYGRTKEKVSGTA